MNFNRIKSAMEGDQKICIYKEKQSLSYMLSEKYTIVG